MEKFNFKKKAFLHVFRERWREGIWDIFVEQIKLYHNLKIQDSWLIYQDIDFEMTTPKDIGKIVVPNSDTPVNFYP